MSCIEPTGMCMVPGGSGAARDALAAQARAAGAPTNFASSGDYFLYHEPGGAVVRDVVHPQITIFERLYRKLPEESWFSPLVRPQSPVIFEIGSYKIPKDMELWLFDFEFSIFQPSGINPGDSFQTDDWHFSGFMGFDIVVGHSHQADAAYELDPTATTLQRDAFRKSGNLPPTAVDFNRYRVNSFAAATSSGTSLLPVRRACIGPREGPFTFVIEGGRVTALNCVIFRQVTGVINWVQATAAGYLLKKNASKALLQGVSPQ